MKFKLMLLQEDGLDVGEFADADVGKFAAVAGLFDAAKRQAGVGFD